jgi:signal transduction histidine kinase
MECDAKGIELKFLPSNDLPSRFESDHQRILQVLHNLISNAIKFSERNSIIKVEAYYFRNERILQVSVIDKGSGIPVEDHHRLFKPYSTLKSAYREGKAGAGLGLYVCKLICLELKGDIKIIPDLKDKTAFTFNVHA